MFWHFKAWKTRRVPPLARLPPSLPPACNITINNGVQLPPHESFEKSLCLIDDLLSLRNEVIIISRQIDRMSRI